MKLKTIAIGAAGLVAGALVTVSPALAADPSGAVLWTNDQFKGIEKSLAAKMDETKSATEVVINKGNFNALVFYREASGQAEIHEKLADFVVVKSGEGSVLVGGKAVGAKPTTPGELRGTAVEGGTKYQLKPGDVLYIPVNTPHQMLIEPGKHLDALVIKVESK